MKRKIVGLKPATEEQFLKQLQKMQLEKEKTEKKQQSYYCDVLNQKFSNYATFANRLTTKKYQKAVEDKKNKSNSSAEQKPTEPEMSDKPEVDSEAMAQANFKKKVSVPTTLESLNICLFSNAMFESFEANLEQMRKNYGFFILDERCCTKKAELIKYLAKIIQKDFSCIYCDARFKNADSAQRHIISKQHAFMNPEYFGQYEKFYDFREENRRVALELQERFKNVKADNQFVYSIKNKPEPAAIAAAPAEPATEIAEDVEDDDGEWEDDEDDHDDEFTEKYNIRKVKKLETGELLLPSGKIAGHRKYKIYYKQRLRFRDPEGNPVGHLISNPGLQRKLLSQEQALVLKISSLPGNENHLALGTYHNFLTKMRKKVDHINHQTYDRLRTNWVKIGISHNRLQKHFRNRNVVFG